MKILAHTSFIGTTGYANHARSFFCALNKIHEVKVRNLTIGDGWKGMSDTPHDDEPYITEEMKGMLILQTLFNEDKSRSDYLMYGYNGDFTPDVHIILEEVDNYYYYEDYEGYKIGFCVYESTRFPENFFKRLSYYDEMWVPTQWQYDSLVDQGYPKEKIKIVTEGVDIETFKPIDIIPPKDKFRFLYFGRWDYRKSTAEVLRAFGETFKDNPNVELIASVENPYSYDDTKSTEDRMKRDNIYYDNIKYVKFVPREDYINYLKEGDVYISCARSEGWNLPLIEAMSCGIPAIYSNWGGQLQFAEGKGIPVKILHLRPANIANIEVLGEYCEPDFMDLQSKMLDVYTNYEKYRNKAILDSELIHKDFNWEMVAGRANEILIEKNELLLSKLIKPIYEIDFHNSNWFYTDINKIENFTPIINIKDSTMGVAEKFSWPHAIYHEVYNIQDYYKNREKKIHKGDVVVDVGANMGVFTRWAYSEGASKVISFEPDKRYFKLLELNSDSRTTLYNAAISDTMGSTILHESDHFGGSNIFHVDGSTVEYETKTYTLNYLFDSGIVDKIDFLKVDIEGGEINAFKGISDENLKKVREIGMEYHHSHLGYNEEVRKNLINRLTGLGFNSYLLSLGSNNALQMLYFSNMDSPPIKETHTPKEVRINFLDGPFVEILDDIEKEYVVEFVDLKENKVVHKTKLKSNHWTKPNIKYHRNWLVMIDGVDNDFHYEHEYTTYGRKVLISFESKALGDTLAWIPQIERYQHNLGAKVVCSTFHNKILKDQYLNIEFVEPGSHISDVYSLFRIGVFKDDNGNFDRDKHPSDPKKLPLGKICSDILGIEYVEMKSRLPVYTTEKKKVVSIATHGTAQCKYWNNPTGWQDVVDYLISKGYEVKLLSKEDSGYMGNKNPKNVTKVRSGSIENIMKLIQESELFIGISSGLSWVSWACGTDTILISGFTDEYTEPSQGIRRIINKNVCNSCWNKHEFDPGDWNWCPEHKKTDKQFECTKEITSQTVIDQINLSLGL